MFFSVTQDIECLIGRMYLHAVISILKLTIMKGITYADISLKSNNY